MAPDVRSLLDALQQEVSKLDDDEDNIELLEGLLGVAFVAAQAHMKWVVRQVGDLRAAAQRNRITINVPHGDDALDFGDKVLGNSRYTRTRVVHELANYFKHGDEWPTCPELKPNQQRTCRVLAAVDAVSCADFFVINGRLRFGAQKVLGSMTNVSEIETILGDWRRKLTEAYEQELVGHGLITAPQT